MNYYIAPGLKKQQIDSYIRTTFRSEDERINLIVNTVEKETGINVLQLKSPKRTREIAEARHICIYLIRKYTRVSAKSVGKFFGGRDHSTVIYAEQTVDDLMVTDRIFKQRFKVIEEQVK